MRRLWPLALIVSLVCLLGFSQSAGATLPKRDIDSAPTVNQKSGEIEAQIAGGSKMAVGSYPYVVRIEGDISETKEIEPFCSGSLVTPRYILTAAHCISDTPWEYSDGISGSGLRVRFGNIPGKPAIPVVRAAFYRDFDYELFTEDERPDVGIMQLSRNAPAPPVNTAMLGLNESDGIKMKTLGYGVKVEDDDADMANDLFAADLMGISREECSRKIKFDVLIHDFCGSGINGVICGGDSGGPVIYASEGPSQGSLIGINVWSPRNSCKPPLAGRISGFSNPSVVRRWVAQQTGASLFGIRGPVSQNITVPQKAKTTITSLSVKGVGIKSSALGRWRASFFVDVVGRKGKKKYDAGNMVRVDESRPGLFFKFPSSWKEKKLDNIHVIVWSRFVNEFSNGVSANPVEKTWRR